MYKRFDIYWVDLEPTKGSETKKKRPCVVIQSTISNKNSRTIIVAPLLPKHKSWPFVVNIKPTKTNGLDSERHINLKQLRAVDVLRFSNKQGVLEKKYAHDINNAMKIVFDII